MGTRTSDLTEVAKKVAEKLRLRVGSLKLVLSAGVIALSKLSADERENMIDEANGPGAEQEGATIADALEAVKAATIHYELLGKDDKEALEELRLVLGPKPKKHPRSPTRKAVGRVAAAARGRSRSGRGTGAASA